MEIDGTYGCLVCFHHALLQQTALHLAVKSIISLECTPARLLVSFYAYQIVPGKKQVVDKPRKRLISFEFCICHIRPDTPCHAVEQVWKTGDCQSATSFRRLAETWILSGLRTQESWTRLTFIRADQEKQIK